MDRNRSLEGHKKLKCVALRKESVDRNPKNPMIRIDEIPSLSARRAWIEIRAEPLRMCHRVESLSARRAWIEIETPQTNSQTRTVALRKESVDRNNSAFFMVCTSVWSLSARRAWIEIETSSMEDLEPSVALRKESVDRNVSLNTIKYADPIVALRKESVDRNIQFRKLLYPGRSRSPQGERG